LERGGSKHSPKRQQNVIIKGYHFDADEVRVSKIIQILVHMVIHIDSPRFVKILGFVRNLMEDDMSPISRPMFGIVMECCDGGSIRSAFDGKGRRHKKYHFEYNLMDKVGILMEVAYAMQELHGKRILHKNLKASNVLLCGGGGGGSGHNIKLTDYCLDVTQLSDFTDSAKERSIRWFAPELVLNPMNYTVNSDVYSFGITCYEIVSGQPPYHEYRTDDVQELLERIMTSGYRPEIEELFAPEALLTLMRRCWHQDPAERPGFKDIVDALEEIMEKLKRPGVSWDDISAQHRNRKQSAKDSLKLRSFQSAPVLGSNDEESSGSMEYDRHFDHIQYRKMSSLDYDEYEDTDDDQDDEKFERAPFEPLLVMNMNRHSKDDGVAGGGSSTKRRRRKRMKHRASAVENPLPAIEQEMATVMQDCNDVQH